MRNKKNLKIRISKDAQDLYYENRMQFKQDRHFFASVLGFAIGCDMILKFPLVVYQNGGITFLVIYIIITLVLIIPVTYLEVALGQINQDGFSQILTKTHPKLRGFGQLGAIICFNISTYYNVQIAYSIVYLYRIIDSTIIVNGLEDAENAFFGQILQLQDSFSDIFYIRFSIFAAYILSISALFLLIKDGIRSSGRIIQYTFVIPLFLMLILLLVGINLEGAYEGIYQLLKPDLRNLINPFVWADAAFHLLFQMSVGFGVLSQYASHRQINQPILPICIYTPLIIFALTMFITALVYSYLGHASYLLNIPVQELIENWDIGFVFFPYIINEMKGGSILLFIFFCTIILLGIDSMIGFVQTLAGTIEDSYYGNLKIMKFRVNGFRLRLIICIVIILSGIIFSSQAGYGVYMFLELFATHIPFIQFLLFEVLFFCILQLLLVGNSFQIKKLDLMMQRDGKQSIPLPIKFSLTYFSHTFVIIISLFCIISQIEQSLKYSWWAIIFGWIISFAPLIYAIKIYKRHQTEYSPIQKKALELPLLSEYFQP